MTIVALALVVIILAGLLLHKYVKNINLKKQFKLINKKVLLIGLIVSGLAVAGSLFYSEIAHYDPCKLCWLQRIFMYPLPILFLIALIKKDRNILPYTLVLSIIGGLIALYQYFLQVETLLFPDLDISTPCGLVGYAPSCTKYFTLQLGFVTIPMMALSAFLLISVISIISLRRKS